MAINASVVTVSETVALSAYNDHKDNGVRTLYEGGNLIGNVIGAEVETMVGISSAVSQGDTDLTIEVDDDLTDIPPFQIKNPE